MTDLATRDARKYISKSFLMSADMCGQRAWHDLHHRLPVVPNERMTFGSAVDAGVQVIIGYLRAGQPVELERAFAAAAETAMRDDVELEFPKVEHALEAFGVAVGPHYNWEYCATQHHIRLELPAIGDVDAHPDVILHDGRIFDVKTSARAKNADAPSTSYTELGLYAVLREAETGKPVPAVGYWTWVRTQKPYWQALEAPVTDAMRRIALARTAAYVRAIEADQILNDGASVPINGTFPAGPKFAGLCSSCAYAPYNGGPCDMAEEEIADAA